MSNMTQSKVLITTKEIRKGNIEEQGILLLVIMTKQSYYKKLGRAKVTTTTEQARREMYDARYY